MIDLETNFSMENEKKVEIERAKEQLLPKNCLPLMHQVAGHFFGKGRTKLGFLQTNDGYVLKPAQAPPRGEREHNFYKRIFSLNDTELNDDEKELRHLLPNYRGAFYHNEIVYIKMDDLAWGIKYPAVIDFKIGRRTYDPEATIEKIERQKLKYPPVERIGFQLLGMRVFDQENRTFSHFDKRFGRKLSEDDIIHGLALYYQFHGSARIKAINHTIKELENIQIWFNKQKTYHFYSSSIIVVYDAENEEQNSSVRIKIADFAHVFPADNERDENYLYGLNNLVKHLKRLIEPSYVFKDVRIQRRIN